MSSIDDLKKNSEPISMEIGNSNNPSGQRHTVINPSYNSDQVDPNSRVKVNISQEMPEEPEEGIERSPYDKLIDVDDPNSLINQYKQKKEEELEEWSATKEQEMEMEGYTEEDVREGRVDITNGGANIENTLQKNKDEDNAIFGNDSMYNNNDSDDEYYYGSESQINNNNVVNVSINVNDEDEYEQPDSVIAFNNNRKSNNIDPVSITVGQTDDDEEEEDLSAFRLDEEIKYDIPIMDATIANQPEVATTMEENNNSNNSKEVVDDDILEQAEIDPNQDINIQGTIKNPLNVVDEEEEVEVPSDTDEVLEHLRELATEKIKPVSRTIDISSFTIAKKPAANLTNLLKETSVKASKWVLPTQQTTVLMKEFLGFELENLRELSEDNTNASILFRRYRMIYDHIVSPKPSTYEAWLKATPYSDLDHYFFAVYIASFKGTNYLPMDCKNQNCKETFLTDDEPIMSMVKFENEEAKNMFTKLYKSDTEITGKGIYTSQIVPLSDRVAIGFKDASIYSLFEIVSLDEDFRNKYSTIIDAIPYIDAMYIIGNGQLIPVGYKIYPDNVQKTIKSKVMAFQQVFSTLTSDEFGAIRPYINNITSRSSGISYIYPSVNCPKCGKATDEIPTTAEELVFTRYQLGALVNTTLK